MKNIYPWNSREYYIMEIEEFSSMSIKKAISRNFNIAMSNFERTTLYESFEALMSEINSAINAGHEEIINLNLKWELHKRMEMEPYPFSSFFYRACYFTAFAQHFAEKGESEKAWALTNYSSFILAESIALIVKKYEINSISTKKEKRSVASSKTREVKLFPVKELVADLLLNNRPRGGWESKALAIRTIESRVVEYIGANRSCGLSISNIKKKIEDWTRRDQKVKDVWEKTKKNKGGS